MIQTHCPSPTMAKAFSTLISRAIHEQRHQAAQPATAAPAADQAGIEARQATAVPSLSFAEGEGPYKPGIEKIENNPDGSMDVTFTHAVNKRMEEAIQTLYPGAEVSNPHYEAVPSKYFGDDDYYLHYDVKTRSGQELDVSYRVWVFPFNFTLNVREQ